MDSDTYVVLIPVSIILTLLVGLIQIPYGMWTEINYLEDYSCNEISNALSTSNGLFKKIDYTNIYFIEFKFKSYYYSKDLFVEYKHRCSCDSPLTKEGEKKQ